MSWRRRTLFVIIVFGTGVYCLRPIVNHSMQRRIAAQLSAVTRIDNTVLSLGQSTVILQGLSIEDTKSKIHVEQLSLKLNPKEFWYRNCIIDSMAGVGLHWYLPSCQSPSSEPSTSDHATSLIDWFADPRFEQAKQLLDNATSRLSFFEKEAKRQVLDLDNRIESIRSKVHELTMEESLLNPLRPNDGIALLKSDLLLLRQSLAENRIQAKAIGKQVAETVQQSNELLQRESNAKMDEGQLQRITDQILAQTIEGASTSLSPYLQAGRGLYFKLLQTDAVPRTSNAFGAFLDGADLRINGLESRKTKIVKCRIEGVSELEDRTEKTEIQIATQSETPALSITWNGDDISKRTSFVTLPSSELKNGYTFRLEQMVKGHSNRLLERATQNGNKIIQMEFAVHYALETPTVKQLGIIEELSKKVSGSKSTPLVARLSTPLDTEIVAREWKWDADSRTFLETLISEAIQQKSKEHATQSSGRLMQLIATEKSQLDRRLAAIEESALARKEGWERQVQLLLSSILEVEKSSSLTARRQSIVR